MMAKKPAIQPPIKAYVADANVTSEGNEVPMETIEVTVEEEVYLSETTKAEMAAGAALVRQRAAEAKTE